MQATAVWSGSPAGSQPGSQRAPPPLGGARVCRLPRRFPAGVRCSSVAGGTSAEAPSTSGRPAAGQEDAGAPSSWPSAAARQAAYGRSPREPALQVPAEVSGRLPAWLKGTYVRNGPGDLADMEHMFDGYGFLVSFALDGSSNSVSASHRFVESKAWQHYRDTGRMKWREFATAPKYASVWEQASDIGATLLGTLGLAEAVTDNASVNVIPLADGGAVAMTETVFGTYRVDPHTLATLGKVEYRGDSIQGDLTTAHPQPLPNGDLLNLVSAVGAGFTLYRHTAAEFERREKIGTVPHRRPLAPAWVHDFPATARHAVIPEMPLYFNVGKLLLGGRSDAVFMDWAAADGTSLHVVDLASGARRTFRAPPCFVFHWANAFESEDGRYLHLDACLYEEPGICNDLYLDLLRAPYRPGAAAGKAFLRRFSLDLQAPDDTEVSWQPLVADEAASPPFDFPKVSPLVRGKQHRYVWGACSTRPTNAHNSVCKFDLADGSVATWHEAGTLVGEPLFVPAPGGSAEDEGVVLVVAIQADGTSCMVVLDGGSLQEVARARLPWKLTTGFHGAWMPAAALGSHQPGRLQPWRSLQQRSQLGGSVTKLPPAAAAGGSEASAAIGDLASSEDWSTAEPDTWAGTSHIVPFPARAGSSSSSSGVAEAEAAHEAVARERERSPPSWPSAAARRSLYSDVPVERVDSLHCRVEGKLPAWLQGSLYRNGPGKFGGALSVIDGCAMIVRFRLDGAANEAVLSHRFLDTVYHRAAQAEGSIRWRMAHSHEGGGASGALQGLAYAGGMALGALQYGGMADNAVVSIVPHGNELIAHTETTHGTYRVHPETLETLGRVRYRDDLHGMVKTAHLSTLPNGDLVGLAADFAPPVLDRTTGLLRMPELTVFRQSPWQADRRVKVAAVPYARPTAPTWVHEVPVSERHAVVVQNPVRYSIRSMLLGQAGEYLAFDWRPEEGTVLHVVPLLGGKASWVRRFRAPAFLAGHWVNAWESEGGRLLHLDACVAASPELMAHWRLDTVRAGPGGRQMVPSYLRRITIDLSKPDGSQLAEPVLQPLAPDAATGSAFEMPAINPAYRCRPYRFTYGASCVRPTNCWNALSKVDTQTGEAKLWHEPGGAVWEPVFVPRPGGRAEDDGVVMSTIMQADGCSALLVLDTRSWTQVARCVVPYGLPQGFHAAWVPS